MTIFQAPVGDSGQSELRDCMACEEQTVHFEEGRYLVCMNCGTKTR